MCEAIAPKVFRLNDNRQSEAVDPDGDTVENILEAAESCPVSAIFVEDAETGEQLFPYLRHSGGAGGKAGRRFSRCEAKPSFTSGPVKPRNSSASEVSKVGPIARSQLLSAYLVQRIAVCAPSASRVAISTALASSSVSSTAREIRPMRSASSPSTWSQSSR